MRRWFLVLGLTAAMMLIQGCYTVVMMPDTTSSRHDTDYEYEDYSYEDYESDSSYTDAPVINEYYIYGDLWPGYVMYDPFWSSPSWYHYHTAWDWWWYDSYTYSPYYNYGWGGYYYTYSPGYYYPRWHYHDPYYTYWAGYYSPKPYKRRPFAHRDAVGRSGQGSISSGNYIPSAGSAATTRRLGKSSSVSRPSAGFSAGTKRSSSSDKAVTSQSSRRVRRTKTKISPSTRTKPLSSSATTKRSNRSVTTVKKPPSSSSSGSGSSKRGSSSGSSSSGSSRRKRR